jgi:L-ascorbate metabolism protein UlaG (beta-lactamase superfamily)
MTARLIEIPFAEPLAQHIRAPARSDPALYWLGQAGFLIDVDGLRIVVDPYLSDTLAKKYASSRFSHERMSPPPVAPDELGPIDLVLCTHHHTDHMDPGTLAPLARLWPRLRFVVPAASAALARERIQVDDARLIAIDAGESVRPLPGLLIRAARAAHETIERDDQGRCRFLGYALGASGVTIFHSGDCVPFAGQREEIAGLAPDLALLPANGRSPSLTNAGFAGNFRIDEALALCEDCSIPAMIAHHYGMFAFNTAEPAEIDGLLAKASVAGTRARMQVAYSLSLD